MLGLRQPWTIFATFPTILEIEATEHDDVDSRRDAGSNYQYDQWRTVVQYACSEAAGSSKDTAFACLFS